MQSIQDLGISILSDSPAKLYIIGGLEYGIKDKYLTKLTEFYGSKIEYPAVADVINLMSKKHLIPLQPALYVVRYDEQFVKDINDVYANKVKKVNIIGTLVCLYTDDKSINKIDKYLPEYTSVVESVNPKFVDKYLHSDFPKLDDRSIKIATFASQNYGHARNICRSMMCADLAELNRKSEAELTKLFGCEQNSNESQVRYAIAGRNFNQLIQLLEMYSDNMDSLMYTILQTMIDMEKTLTAKYPNTDLKDYIKFWTIQDVYYMFMHTYKQLESLRSNTSGDIESSLIYLFSVLTFRPIPPLEAMTNEL